MIILNMPYCNLKCFRQCTIIWGLQYVMQGVTYINLYKYIIETRNSVQIIEDLIRFLTFTLDDFLTNQQLQQI